MEINEMENIWRSENERLKSKLYVNEKSIRNIHINKSVNSFKDMYNTSVMGRNMALVYAAISIVFAVMYVQEFQYSIPLIIGAAGMVISFIQHLALNRPKNYHTATVMELQKAIQKFRIHTMKHKYYDMFFVILWMMTLAPLYYKWKNGLDVYGNTDDLIAVAMKLGVVLFVVFGISMFIYSHFDKKLSNSISVLKELEEFESDEQ